MDRQVRTSNITPTCTGHNSFIIWATYFPPSTSLEEKLYGCLGRASWPKPHWYWCYRYSTGSPPSEYKLADQISTGFENIPIISALFPITPNKNVNRINYILEGLRALSVKLKEHSGVDTSMWDNIFGKYFGRFKGLILSVLLSLAIFVGILVTCGCCCVPCIKNLCVCFIISTISHCWQFSPPVPFCLHSMLYISFTVSTGLNST